LTEVTQILQEAGEDDARLVDRLLPVVYEELRKMASAKVAREPDQTLDATGLVHEAYLRLVGSQSFNSRRHFFGAAAEAMRRILIDRARAKQTVKRGQAPQRVALDPNQVVDLEGTSNERLEMLNQAIDRLAEKSPEKAELVKLRYFVGLTIREAADILGISTATADRNWKYAKAWLKSECSPK
jgi:RNA polymerase sigma factor (TIGR02999 family)